MGYVKSKISVQQQQTKSIKDELKNIIYKLDTTLKEHKYKLLAKWLIQSSKKVELIIPEKVVVYNPNIKLLEALEEEIKLSKQ